jgi:S1-C subfamily serine protease
VTEVQPGSPAAKAGLSVGDLLLQVNGKTPQNLIDCNRLLVSGPHLANLTTERGSQRRTIVVRLLSFAELVRHRLGLTLLEITPQTASSLGVQPGEALLIDQVERGSQAERAQLKRGYLLAATDDRATATLRNVAEVLSGKKRGDTVRLTVIVPSRLGGYLQLQKGTVDLEVRQ